MIENKLYQKLLSLNRIAARLSFLSNKVYWAYTIPDNSALLPGYSPSSFFYTKEHESNGSNIPAPENTGLKEAILGFRNSINHFSGKMSGLAPVSYSDTTIVKSSFEKLSSSTVKETSHYVNAGIQNVLNSVWQKKYIALKENTTRLGISGLNNSFLVPGMQFNHLSSTTNLNNGDSSLSKSVFSKDVSVYNEINHFASLSTVTDTIQNNSRSIEKLLDADVTKKVQMKDKITLQEKPSYTIHQTFGDIVIQPAAMDVSMQQLKVKIQDILKQARDSMY